MCFVNGCWGNSYVSRYIQHVFNQDDFSLITALYNYFRFSGNSTNLEMTFISILSGQSHNMSELFTTTITWFTKFEMKKYNKTASNSLTFPSFLPGYIDRQNICHSVFLLDFVIRFLAILIDDFVSECISEW